MATNKEQLNQANLNQLADFLRDFKFGDILRALPACLRKKATVAGGASNYNLATVNVLVLPADAKASVIHRATIRAGGVTGESTPQAFGTTPATTQCAVTPCGDIAFVAADAPSDFDVVYTPEKGDVYELNLDCVASVATIPATYTARGVVLLMEAEATAAAVAGKKIVLAPGAGAPATTQARLNAAKTTVTFNNGTDAVTKCRVKILVAAAADTDTKLQATASY